MTLIYMFLEDDINVRCFEVKRTAKRESKSPITLYYQVHAYTRIMGYAKSFATPISKPHKAESVNTENKRYKSFDKSESH